MYDYLIVGAGLSGAIFAHEATKRGKKVKVIDKRDHIGGNIYCEEVEGINVHKYGAHIFHTSNKKVWDYVNQFAEFNNYINSPVANYKGSLYNLPFNMNTFYAMWGTKTPQEVKDKIAEQTADMKDIEPNNLEEQAIKLIGPDIYEKLIKGYTEKQWGRSATDLPPFIIKRLPVRLTFDNNYFNDRYQGIPIGGYNVIIENMLGDVEVELGVDFFANREELESSAEKVVFTGMIDQYFDYKHGELEYRSLRFEHEILDEENHQGNAVVNYTEREIPYTRIIEHKHFEYGTQPKTVITREYPADWKRGDEPYYPINDEKNNAMFAKYQEEAEKNDKVIFCGRLADYKYYDMHVVIERALEVVANEFDWKKQWFMKYFLKEEFLKDSGARNAGNKARNDVEEIVKREGYQLLLLTVEDWYQMGTVKAQQHKAKALAQAFSQLKSGDQLLIQFPMLHHSFFTTRLVRKIQRRGVQVYFIIHDLEALRYANLDTVPLKHKIRVHLQESSLLKVADGVIAHNPIMKSVLVEKGIPEHKLVSLEIFDYLIPNYQEKGGLSKDQPIIVAGNLAQEKAGYLYQLPARPAYNLYGVGFDESRALANETYFGSFLPDELPAALVGGFGLVWDGDSAETCSGVFGEYLRYNNSHKASLYLALGFPLVVWKQSALSHFVLENGCGIAVESLYDLSQALEQLDDKDYQDLLVNTRRIGQKIRDGSYLTNALNKIVK